MLYRNLSVHLLRMVQLHAPLYNSFPAREIHTATFCKFQHELQLPTVRLPVATSSRMPRFWLVGSVVGDGIRALISVANVSKAHSTLCVFFALVSMKRMLRELASSLPSSHC